MTEDLFKDLKRKGFIPRTLFKRRQVVSWNFGSSVVETKRKLVLMCVVATFSEAWALMLVLGMFAGYLAIPGLALGYWACYGIKFLIDMAKGSVIQARDYF